MARDEDIFKKLKKQTPIVKQKSLQQLSQSDFKSAKSTLSIPVEYKGKQIKKAPRRDEPVIFSGADESVKYSKVMKRESDALKYGSRTEYKKAQEKNLEAFGEKQKTYKPDEPSRLDVFTDNVKPQRTFEPKAPVRAEAAHDISYLEHAEQSGGMAMRHELKYYINYRDYVLLRGSLKALMSPDPFAGEDNSYHIRSLYFDDINETALREKIAGNDYRRKYRIRIYNLLDDNIKFEKKYKVGQYIGKKSIRLDRGEYESIIAGDYAFLLDRREELAKELYLELRGSLLRPRVIVDYIREAYVSPFENCRITFDKDLKAGIMLKDIFDPNIPLMPMYENGIMVLEVKFNKFLPVTVKQVLNTVNAAGRSAISKYVISRKFD